MTITLPDDRAFGQMIRVAFENSPDGSWRACATLLRASLTRAASEGAAPDDAERLGALIEKATPLPWREAGDGGDLAIRSMHGVCPTAHHNGCVIATFANHHEPQRNRADRDLAVAAVNLIPALLMAKPGHPEAE